MTFRVKISILLIVTVLISLGGFSIVNAHFVARDQVTQLGDFQGAMTSSIKDRLDDSFALMSEQFMWLLKKESKPLTALSAPLEAYLGGAVWKGENLIEATPREVAKDKPNWDGRVALLPGSALFSLSNFGLGIQSGDLKLVVYLESKWLKNFSPSSVDVALGLSVGDKIISSSGSFEESLSTLKVPFAKIPQTRWISNLNREKFLVSTYPLLAQNRAQLVLATPSSKIYAVLRQSFYRTVAIAIALMLISFGVAQWISWAVSRPLKELEEATQGVAKGQFRLDMPKSTHRKDEFGILGRAFIRMGMELEKLQKELIHSERLSALGKFSAGIVHEIKNPLTGVLLNAEMAQMQLKDLGKHEETKEVDNTLAAIIDDTKRANRKISSLMKFSRKEEVTMQPIDLVLLLNRWISTKRPTLQFQGVEVEVVINPKEAFIEGNSDNLHELFDNLFQNAAYAMRSSVSKILTVKVAVEENSLIIQIKDTGSGMTEETLGRLFEPFFTTKPSGEGTGLGLAACQGIVKSHQGIISAKSRVNEGTEFTLSFPLVAFKSQTQVA